jgi:hypothetical protein
LVDRRKLYLGFTVRIASNPAGHPSEVWGYDDVRLMIDGELQGGSPEISDSYGVDAGAVVHARYVFDVPTTGKVELV